MSPNLTLPFIVSPSTVAAYSSRNSCPCAFTLTVNLISLPLTVPSSGDSPNRPLYVPVNFSPSCFNTTEGEPGPFGVSMVNFQLPVTFVDCAATVRKAAKMKAAVMIEMEAMMCLRIRFIVSPRDRFQVACGGSPTVREGVYTALRPPSRSGYRHKAMRVEPVINGFDRTGHD